MKNQTKSRKAEHLEIALKKNVQFRKKSTLLEEVSFEGVELVYKALPEIDKKEVNTEIEFLGKKFNAPLIVEAITGGIKEAEKINKDIAKACEALGIGMGLGSIRAMLEDKKLARTYFVRDVAPNIFLAGNIGVTQLKEYSAKEIEKALKEIKADALAVHVNAAQEALQPEGSMDFSGLIEKIKELCEGLSFPVYVKEVGHGISREIAEELRDAGIQAIDVGGAGGTSWTAIDSMRGDKKMKEIGKTYWDFGIPTAASLIEVKSVWKGKIIASGGIRNGLDIVKAIALGADLGGIALPVLKAQQKGKSRAVQQYLERIIEEVRIGMFLIGAKNVKEIKEKEVVLGGKLKEWKEQRIGKES